MSAPNRLFALFFQQLKARDEMAWDTLFAHVYQRLLWDVIASLRRRSLPLQEADDVAQEALLTAFQKIDQVDCDNLSSLYYWIRVISFNYVRNRMRKKDAPLSIEDVAYQHADNDLAIDTFFFNNGHHELPIESAVIQREDVAQIIAALDCIKPRDREIFLRRYLDGEKPHELARHFPGLKARSISQVLSRTRRTIQQICKDSPSHNL